MNKNEIIDFVLQLPLPAAHFEASGEVVCLNSAFTKLLGYTTEDFTTVEEHWPLFFPDVTYREKVQRDWIAMLEESEKTGVPIQPMLLDIVALNGEVKKLEVHSLQVGTLAVTMWIDFTQRLKNEEELKIINQRYALSSEVASLGIWDWDLSKDITIWNERMFEIYGIPKQVPMPYEDWQERVHPDDLSKAEDSLKRAIENKTRDDAEFRIIQLDKSIRYVYASQKAIVDKNNEVVRVLGINLDITDKKNLETILKERTRELEEQVIEHNILIESTSDGFWIIDENGNLLDVNDAYCKMSGYSKDELLRMKVSDLERIESPEETELHIKNIINNGSDTFDTVHRKKNGEDLNVNITVTMINSNEMKFITSIRDITERKKHEKEVNQLAYFDKLTNLPNRTLLADRIEHAINHSNRNNRDLAICMVDLDGFKEVNDIFGHDAGDYILIEAAKRMKQEVRENDTVARLGGDEFVLILTDIISNEACALALQRVLDALSKAYVYKNQSIDSISASIGISIYPTDKVHSDALLRHADIAMYKSKNTGKNKFTFFDTTLENKVQETSKILARMKKAINSNQLCLHYQAKYETKSNSINEVEALVRWNHPRLGLLQPAEFLPMIQNDDELSLLLDQWVVNAVFTQLSLWREQNIELKICVNISPKQFKGNVFKDWLYKLVESEKISKALLKHIEFEILETAVMDNLEESNEYISRLQESGASFALDDFGTGYSSLIHLKELNINTIKIDQVFVREMFDNSASMTIVKAVIALSKAFEISVTAEGAETDEHVNKLIEMGCDEIQGYAISRPIPAMDIPEFISTFEFKQTKKVLKGKI